MAVKPKLCVAVALAASVIATGCMMPATFDEDFANMAVEKKDYPKAIADAKQATALFPSRGTAWETLGVAYYFNNQNDEAITALRKAEELGRNGGGLLTPFPESYLERTYYFLGASYLKKGDNSEAIAWLGKALQLAPANAITHNDLGNAYFFEGQNEKAAAEYKRALEINPNDAVINQNYQRTLQRLNQESSRQRQEKELSEQRRRDELAGLADSDGSVRQLFKLQFSRNYSVSDITEALITWKNRHLDGLLRTAKLEDLRDYVDQIEHTIFEATDASEKEKDAAQQLVAGGASADNAHADLARAYRLRIEVLKPILAAIKEEIANRNK